MNKDQLRALINARHPQKIKQAVAHKQNISTVLSSAVQGGLSGNLQMGAIRTMDARIGARLNPSEVNRIVGDIFSPRSMFMGLGYNVLKQNDNNLVKSVGYLWEGYMLRSAVAPMGVPGAALAVGLYIIDAAETVTTEYLEYEMNEFLKDKDLVANHWVKVKNRTKRSFDEDIAGLDPDGYFRDSSNEGTPLVETLYKSTLKSLNGSYGEREKRGMMGITMWAAESERDGYLKNALSAYSQEQNASLLRQFFVLAAASPFDNRLLGAEGYSGYIDKGAREKLFAAYAKEFGKLEDRFRQIRVDWCNMAAIHAWLWSGMLHQLRRKASV